MEHSKMEAFRDGVPAIIITIMSLILLSLFFISMLSFAQTGSGRNRSFSPL